MEAMNIKSNRRRTRHISNTRCSIKENKDKTLFLVRRDKEMKIERNELEYLYVIEIMLFPLFTRVERSFGELNEMIKR